MLKEFFYIYPSDVNNDVKGECHLSRVIKTFGKVGWIVTSILIVLYFGIFIIANPDIDVVLKSALLSSLLYTFLLFIALLANSVGWLLILAVGEYLNLTHQRNNILNNINDNITNINK